ncbi:hypothetical protein K7X08_007691 [Anisodus acutangulus]|uniref:Uncharacterized protein n=1 Tax=Anisodus acutangulus TaxID=402998 RepID=A0A9Q1LG56_9SOLA|nr:hypothetical protein K7X08_007691 [Anisodus acutangulus]
MYILVKNSKDRFQRPSSSTHLREEWHAKVQSGSSFQEDDDEKANLVRFSASSSSIAKDKCGWLLNPNSLALDSAISENMSQRPRRTNTEKGQGCRN